MATTTETLTTNRAGGARWRAWAIGVTVLALIGSVDLAINATRGPESRPAQRPPQVAVERGAGTFVPFQTDFPAVAAPATVDAFVPFQTDFPVASPAVVTDGFVPFVTDFPSAAPNVDPDPYVPFVTDFPAAHTAPTG